MRLPLISLFAFMALAVGGGSGCRTRPPVPAEAAPVESLYILAAEIKRETNYDFYRRPWPRDVAGYNPFRAGLIRLGNFVALNPDVAPDVVAFLRGECSLFLRDYSTAVLYFSKSAEYPGPLKETALRRAKAASQLNRVAAPPESFESIEDGINAFAEKEKQCNNLRGIFRRAKRYDLARLALLEAEQAAAQSAEFLTDYYLLSEGGLAEAGRAWKNLLEKHPKSARRMRYRLALGRLYEEAAFAYLMEFPAEAGAFDLDGFLRFARVARAEFQQVALAYGYDERPVGEARLAAINALIEETIRQAR